MGCGSGVIDGKGVGGGEVKVEGLKKGVGMGCEKGEVEMSICEGEF